MLRFRFAGASDEGLVRPHNEDAGYAGPYLLLVADGVGGSAAGEVAAASTAYVVTSAATMSEVDDPIELLTTAVKMAHEHLVRGCADEPSRRGMSTTLTALLCDGRRVGMVHLGDSRAYRWRSGELTQLSRDHTLVQALIDGGELTVEDAISYPHRSVIMRSMDGETDPDPDTSWIEIEVGDRLMVCSDGLSDLVSDDDIATLLAGPPAPGDGLDGQAAATSDRDGDRVDLDWAVDRLVDAALAAGGRDNITCIVGEVTEGPLTRPLGRPLGAFTPPNLIDGTVVRVVHTEGGRTVRLDVDSPEAVER